MDENAIKAEVLTVIRRQSRSRQRPVVASEYQILSGQTRADLAVFDSDSFVGIEIKSPKDTLKRLKKQAVDYRRSFDKTILVLDGSHLIDYLGIDFDFCDVWTFDFDGELRLFSEGDHFPLPDQNFYEMLTLREREIAFRDAKLAGLSKRQVFRHFFEAKFHDSSAAFWDSVKGRKIRSTDISLLSRFRDSREKAKLTQAQNRADLDAWLAAQSR